MIPLTRANTGAASCRPAQCFNLLRRTPPEMFVWERASQTGTNTRKEKNPTQSYSSPRPAPNPCFSSSGQPTQVALTLVFRAWMGLSESGLSLPSDVRNAGGAAGETPGLVHQLETKAEQTSPAGQGQPSTLRELSTALLPPSFHARAIREAPQPLALNRRHSEAGDPARSHLTPGENGASLSSDTQGDMVTAFPQGSSWGC